MVLEALRFVRCRGFHIYRESAHRWRRSLPACRNLDPIRSLVLICVRNIVIPRAIVGLAKLQLCRLEREISDIIGVRNSDLLALN
jgi:hypothetical protein